ncbi:hypothetical protein [Clostridium sp.]|jgi:hypothetical protein|uniref:hypothetical protein n=1 Tax=Clostridium sp. TaxID=1506 RepID=UPI003EEA93F5
MTASEFKEGFNLRYNNALEGAPGLDTYEISSYLTIGQEQLVKTSYDADKDPTSSFELKEKSRRILNELVKDEKITLPVASTRGLVDESKFYELSESPMYIVLETATINGKVVKVIPVTHDEFILDYPNPFRKPNGKKVWRMDVSKENSKTTVELISSVNITRYNVRYLTFPSPIIIGSLLTSPDVLGMGLTINGQTAVATSVLSELAHTDIVNIAVENAVLDYRESSLKARVEMDSRV